MFIADHAVKQALSEAGGSSTYPLTIHDTSRGDAWPVDVQAIQPLDVALLNGAIRLEVTPPRRTDDVEGADGKGHADAE